jgi:hypothetical protein
VGHFGSGKVGRYRACASTGTTRSTSLINVASGERLFAVAQPLLDGIGKTIDVANSLQQLEVPCSEIDRVLPTLREKRTGLTLDRIRRRPG